MQVIVRIDSVGRATCAIDSRQPVRPDFEDGSTRAFQLTPAPSKMTLAVAVSPARESTSVSRAVDYQGNLIHIRRRHLDGNGVATFSPFTHGNFVVMMEERSPTQAQVLIRKIGVRRQDTETSWAIIENKPELNLDMASPVEEAVKVQVTTDLHKFVPAMVAMWADIQLKTH